MDDQNATNEAIETTPTESQLQPQVAPDAQQLQASMDSGALASLKSQIQTARGNAVVTGRWLADCPGQRGIHVKAESRTEAVKLVCDYLGCEPQQVVVSACKRKAAPRNGERVLRAHPVAGKDGAVGFIYGIEK